MTCSGFRTGINLCGDPQGPYSIFLESAAKRTSAKAVGRGLLTHFGISLACSLNPIVGRTVGWIVFVTRCSFEACLTAIPGGLMRGRGLHRIASVLPFWKSAGKIED